MYEEYPCCELVSLNNLKQVNGLFASADSSLSFLSIQKRKIMKKYHLLILFVGMLCLSCGSDDTTKLPIKPGGGEPPAEGQNPNLPSKLSLPYIMSDNMVLQQNQNANIWGKAIPGSKIEIEVSWSSTKYSALTQLTGIWEVPVPTPTATTAPQTLKITDSQRATKTISNVLIGEVWICSGQSNMEMPMRGFGTVAGGNFQPIKNADAEMATANIPTFRYFKVPYADLTLSSTELQFNTKASSWAVCTPANAREYSAIAFFFGRKLGAELNIPIGMIGCSYGGTRIEAWMDPNALKSFSPDEYKDAAEVGGVTHKSAPHILYRGMINPVTKYTMRGFLWLQGESNFDNKASYSRLLKEMAAGWRNAWGNKDGTMPFYIVQIAPYGYSSKTDAAYMMEAQQAASKLIPNSECVSATDVGDKALQHYPDKKVPAERLVNMALNRVYGKSNIKADAPTVKSVDCTDNVVTVEFNNATTLSCAAGNVPFVQVAASDGIFYDAVCKIVAGEPKITATSSSVAKAAFIRYCFTSWHVGQLFNESGLPVFPFRTDTL